MFVDKDGNFYEGDMVPGDRAATVQEIADQALLKQSAAMGKLLQKVRDMRPAALDALNGIASRAARAGDGDTALAADTAAEALLALTKDPDVLGATTPQALMVLLVTKYAAIVDATPENVKSAFNSFKL